MSSYQPPEPALSSKSTARVAIPRLPHPTSRVPNANKDRRRVSRACTACRIHKIKCTGATPLCKHCAMTGRECTYVLPRKDRVKILTERCAQMSVLLRDLKPYAGDELEDRIEALLNESEEDTPSTQHPATSSTPENESTNYQIENQASDSPINTLDGSSLDFLDEDVLLDERARATGFIGKNSEVQWIRSIVMHLDRTVSEYPKTSDQGHFRRRSSFALSVGDFDRVADVTFYMDCDAVDVDDMVDPHTLPDPDTAALLLDCYSATVHDSFPILPHRALVGFRAHIKSVKAGNAPHLSLKWQAIMNLVMAIGARYSHLVDAEWRCNEQDYKIYHSRARACGLEELTLANHPDIPAIQVIGLLAFYHLSMGQISRSWIVLGAALRFACALGLHVRNEDPTAPPTKKEMLVRTWWSIYALERQLCVMMGRPGLMVDSFCSVPLPSPLAQDQLSDATEELNGLQWGHPPRATPTPSPTTSTPSTGPYSPSFVCADLKFSSQGLYFKSIVQLGTITQAILTSLYSAGTMIKSLANIKEEVIVLGRRLDAWSNALPWDLKLRHDLQKGHRREAVTLGIELFSARILLTRPFLEGVNQEVNGNNPESFNRRMVSFCIDAAKRMIDLFPDVPDFRSLYERGSWWSIVHNIMQAVSIFLLALLHSSSSPQDTATLCLYLKKLVNTLGVMQDPLARKAYQITLGAVEGVATRMSLDWSSLGLRSDLGSSSDGNLPSVSLPNDRSFYDPLPSFDESASDGTITAIREIQDPMAGLVFDTS